MCTVCGCGAGEVKIEGGAHEHTHVHEDGTVHTHTHDHGHDHDHAHTHDDAPLGVHSHTHHHSDGSEHSHAHVHEGEHAHEHGHEHGHEHHHHHEHAVGGDLDYGTGPARAHVPGMSQARMVQIEQDILSKNNAYAAANRQWFDERGIFVLNLVSSPGSGKTTLLCKTIELLKGSVAINVVEGDQQTANDAERIRATGVPALQINTGKGCHLDGHMVGHAMQRLQPKDESLFLIENVGNLVCPAAFDLGEHHKVAILSVTEGEDKPLKYPDMFAAAQLMLLTKTDLLPHLSFDVQRCVDYARRVNPGIRILQLSATTGEGMNAWIDWLLHPDAIEPTSVQTRIAQLEAELARLKAGQG